MEGGRGRRGEGGGWDREREVMQMLIYSYAYTEEASHTCISDCYTDVCICEQQ